MELDKIIAPSFYHWHRDIVVGGHTFYKLAGGRGSTKSTFVGTEIPLGIMRDAEAGNFTNTLAYRRYKDNLRGSVRVSFVAGYVVASAAYVQAHGAADFISWRGQYNQIEVYKGF